MKNYILFFLSLFSCYFNNVFANDITLRGTVKGKNHPVEYYSIDVFDIMNDTTLIAQDNFTDSVFSMTTPYKEKLLIRIFGFGFEIFDKEAVVTENTTTVNLGTIELQAKDMLLNEVTIIAKKPVFQLNGSKMQVNVQNSALKDIGNANDVLNHIPGIRTVNGKYDILGRGVPVIYIDGKQVQTKNALSLLKSSNIAEITVDRNPSAEYSAQTNAVILITTKKQIQDMLGVAVQNLSAFRRLYSNTSALSVNWKKGIVSANFNYDYSMGNSKIYESPFRYIHNDNSLFYSNTDYTDKSNSIEHDLGASVVFDVNKKNTIGFQYSAALSPQDKDLLNKQQTIEENGQNTNRLIDQNDKTATNEQQISANYIYHQNKNNELAFIFDYIFKNVDKNSLIYEQNQMSETGYDTQLLSGNRYDVYTTTLNYKFMAFGKFKSFTGLRYAQINNNSENNFVESLINDNSKSNLSDQIGAAYIQTSRDWGKFSVNAGLRYEYDRMRIKTVQDSITTVNRNFPGFFPVIALSYKPTDKASFELSYTKRISRPSFFNLNSNNCLSGTSKFIFINC